MASLVATEEVYIEEVDDNPIVTILSETKDSEVGRKKRILDPPPEPQKMPSGNFNERQPADNKIVLPSKINVPTIKFETSINTQDFALGVIKDNDAIPLSRSLPKYPLSAAREKIKGWVKVSFDLNRKGIPMNIVVTEAEPVAIFDQAAIDAVKTWKYKAKVDKGKTVAQYNLSVRLDFGKK